ncbi:MAG: hypothetical protein FWF84_00095 [Kiritimatiellaeota bacterium]|nr:hypothetical protein [Kiritimatiellota bacterium]
MKGNDVRKAAGFMGALCAAAWLAAAPGSDWDMALDHERGLAEGLGLLVPGPDRYVIDRGLIPMPEAPGDYTFPSYFFYGLVATQHLGFTVWPVSAVVEDAGGVTEFYDANGQRFAGAAPFHQYYSSNWVARLWLGDPPPEPLDPIYLPSKVESRWTFVAQSNMAAYAAARLGAAYTNAPPGGGAPASPLFGVPGLRVSEFRPVEGGFHFGLDAGGLAAYPHPMFHVLFTEDLAARDWRPVRREAAPQGGGASFAVPYAEVFGADNPFAVGVTHITWWDGSEPTVVPQTGQHAPWCVQSTNTVTSPLSAQIWVYPTVVTYTRVTCSCGARGAASPKGFFALVSDVDSAGCGVPDWWLNLHGVNPADVLDPVPGAEWIDFRDLYLSGLSPNVLPPPPAGITHALPFRVFGDYAAWEMTVKGAGPLDFSTRRVGPSAIGYPAERTLSLFKGNYYIVSVRWLDSRRDQDVYWYCWEAAVDGLPAAAAFESYSPIRIPGAATTVRGDGFIVNNAGGLFTQHVHMKDGLGGNVAGSLTATLYVYGVGEDEPLEIGFKKAGGALTDTLPVSKWANAFEIIGGEVRYKKANIIDTDPDRYQVYVKDRRRTEPVIWGYLTAVTDPPGDPSYIPLYRQPDGTYLSTNRIIVADSTDLNAYAIPPPEFSPPPPPKFLMTQRALGEEIMIEYLHDGTHLLKTATVGEDVKTLTVEVAAMIKENGNWCVEYWDVWDDIRMMNERYAQANIKVVWDGELNHFFAPPSVATNMAGWAAVTRRGYLYEIYEMTQETRDVIDASGLGTNNLRVIYVPGDIRMQNIHVPGIMQTAMGLAFPQRRYSSDSNYVDTCFVSSSEATDNVERLVPGHETTHLLERSHSADRWNLMHKDLLLANDPRGTRRLTQEQVNGMRAVGLERNKLR